MSESFKESETLKEVPAVSGRPLETTRLEESRVITDRIPAISGTGGLELFNWLIDKNLATFLVYIPGAGHREVMKFLPMVDRFFIMAICKDKVKDTPLDFVVSHYTTFGVYLNSETWFL